MVPSLGENTLYTKTMIIPIDNDTSIDTDNDLSPEERHIVQKLLCYKYIASSISEFRQQKQKALATGWNNSGPIKESRTVALIATQLEKEINARLSTD